MFAYQSFLIGTMTVLLLWWAAAKLWDWWRDYRLWRQRMDALFEEIRSRRTYDPDNDDGKCNDDEIEAMLSSPEAPQEYCRQHVDCSFKDGGKLGPHYPVDNDRLKTAELGAILSELGNRSIGVVGMIYVEEYNQHGQMIRYPHVFLSGDPLIQVGLMEELSDHVHKMHHHFMLWAAGKDRGGMKRRFESMDDDDDDQTQAVENPE